ncbi:MAG: hypothetical protein IJ407_03900 [Clostridia bacterium]|nr:hypothetical protein [Clostridia bacterium]
MDLGVANAAVTYTNELGQKTFAFDVSALQNEIFTEAGAYSYRVVEIVNDSYVANGYVYDATPAYFDVIVSDNEQGQLYISNVAAGTDATVATATVGDVTEWTVNASFENRYEVNGAAEAVINIKKTVTGNKGALIPPSGFEFTLYHADGQWTKGEEAGNAPATSTAGTTDIALLFNDATQVGTKYYVLEEKVPASADSRIDYSEEAYGIKVDVGTESGNYTITVTVYKLENGTATFINTYTGSAGTVTVAEIPDGVITFENTFTPEAAVAPAITATKNLTGKKLTADLFEFELYEITPQGEVWKETVGNKAPANADDPTAAVEFTALTFEQAGTYQYVVREKLPAGIDANNKHLGTTYDTRKYTVTVTVTGDNTTGTLTASWVSALDGYVTDIVFDNLYTVDPVTDVVIGGTKHLTGGIRKLQANAFYFELLQNDQVIGNVGNGVPTDDANAAFAFEPLTFYTVGTYYYTVREHRPDGVDASNPTRFGVTYDLNEYDVTVVVTDQGDGTLHAQVQYPEGTPAFENSYHVSPTSVDLTGTKTLIGDAIAKYTGEKAFVYELYAAEYDLDTKTVEQGAKITEAREDGTGTFAFNASAIAQLNFSAIGAYRFVIREQIPADADPLMNYDESVYFIEVDVSDDLQGGLKTDMKVTKVDEHGASSTVGSDEINFINELMEEPVAVELGGTKSYNKTLTDGQFTFELYQAMERNGEIVAVGEPLLEATNAADGSFKFEEMLLTDELSGLQVMTTYMTFSKAGTYHFVIKEKLPEGVSATNKHKDGITYDTNSYVVTVEVTEVTDHTGRDVLVYEVTADGVKNGSITVTNIYDPADAKVTLSGTKTLTGRDMTDGEFTFELYSVAKDGAETLKEFKTNASGTFTFSELIFDQADTYRYKIVEKKGDAVKVAYDETVYEVEIVVTDVNGVLIPETTINGEETTTVGFKNVYDPDDAKVTLSGNKLLTGRALKDGEFTFELYSVKDGAETLKEAVTNKGSAFTFSEMIFDKAENYQYKIIEKKGDAAKVTYDETVYQVQIVVTDINGVLTPSVTVNGSAETKIIFKNAYDPDDAKLAISGTKNLTGRDLVDGEFTFELYSVDQNGTETLLESKTNVGNTFVFSERVYDQVGEYHYRVKEMAGTDSTITYDTKTYDLVVKVTDANGVLNAAVVVDGSKDATVVFNNLYTPPIVPEPTPEPTPEPVPEPVPTPTPNEDEPTSPYTGGGSNPGLLIALFVITGGLLFLFFKKRKVENR